MVLLQCLTEVGLHPDEVKDCANGREGQVLLAGMGEKTPRDIDFVPTVNFNGVSLSTYPGKRGLLLLHR